jgi:hypothetical protein
MCGPEQNILGENFSIKSETDKYIKNEGNQRRHDRGTT